jgi:hypothetical protein
MAPSLTLSFRRHIRTSVRVLKGSSRDPSTDRYTVIDPIEREVRRRIFFLLFQADKSESVLAGRPIRLREEECYSLRLPEELYVMRVSAARRR